MPGLARTLELSLREAEKAAGRKQDPVGGVSACSPLPVLSSSFEAVPVDPARALLAPEWILPEQLCLREGFLVPHATSSGEMPPI